MEITQQHIDKMIERRVSKGNNLAESVALFTKLVLSHKGHNLAYALVYNEYATEAQALKLVGVEK
jgi:hypothetical protein